MADMTAEDEDELLATTILAFRVGVKHACKGACARGTLALFSCLSQSHFPGCLVWQGLREGLDLFFILLL